MCVSAPKDTVTHEVSERSKEKASLDQLQKAYTDLNSRKIKDALSSFLPDIPGKPHLSPWLMVGLFLVGLNR